MENRASDERCGAGAAAKRLEARSDREITNGDDSTAATAELSELTVNLSSCHMILPEMD